MFDLKKKIIVVTGGSGFFGKIIVSSIEKFNGIPIIIDLKRPSKKKIFYQADITSEKEVKKVSEEIIKKYKSVYGLINNAASNDPKLKNIKINEDKLENFDLNRWKRDIDISLTGSFLCSKYFGQQIIKNKKGGVIINISSDLGLIAPNHSLYELKTKKKTIKNKKPISYSVSKSGIIGLTRYLSTYWSNKNLRCNCICPGGIYNNQNKNFHKKLIKLIPLKRMANKNDYSSTLIWMLSENTEYLNGAIISVDGGRTAW